MPETQDPRLLSATWPTFQSSATDVPLSSESENHRLLSRVEFLQVQNDDLRREVLDLKERLSKAQEAMNVVSGRDHVVHHPPTVPRPGQVWFRPRMCTSPEVIVLVSRDEECGYWVVVSYLPLRCRIIRAGALPGPFDPVELSDGARKRLSVGRVLSGIHDEWRYLGKLCDFLGFLNA